MAIPLYIKSQLKNMMQLNIFQTYHLITFLSKLIQSLFLFCLVIYIQRRETRFGVNYQKFNTIISKNKYFLRYIKEILSPFHGANLSNKMKIQELFYQISMLKNWEKAHYLFY